MKIPDNNTIFEFIKKYGIAVLLGVVIWFFLSWQLRSLISRTKPVCQINDLETTAVFSYKGVNMRTIQFDYNEWSNSEDTLYIRAQEIE